MYQTFTTIVLKYLYPFQYLEEYLEELAEVQITFDGGETMMNFAEAAMLIQGSATVYSKKVIISSLLPFLTRGSALLRQVSRSWIILYLSLLI